MHMIGNAVHAYTRVMSVTNFNNADIKKWEEEQIGIVTVRFGAKDAKEKNKVNVVTVTSTAVAACESLSVELCFPLLS